MSHGKEFKPAPKAAVFLSHAEPDITLVYDVAGSITRLGAAVFLDEVGRRDPELYILNALAFADEVLLLITHTPTVPLKTPSTRAFIDRRYVWLAIGVAAARRIPILGLLKETSRKEIDEDQTIPKFVRDLPLFDNLASYENHLRNRATKHPLTATVPPPTCHVCLCQGGRHASFLDAIENRLGDAGILSNRWTAKANFADFHAAIVVLDGKASADWGNPAFVSFLQDFFELQKPVAFVTLPGPSPMLPTWFQPAWRVEYRESDNLTFLQLAWTIVGYRQYELGIYKEPAVLKRDKPPKAIDRTHIRERPALPKPSAAIPKRDEPPKAIDRTDIRERPASPISCPPLRVFISYSHKDERLRRELETHLKLLQRQQVIGMWSDHQIMPGEEWKDKIDDNLESAGIILLLVSADFAASDYCYDVEMTRALARNDVGEARVIPIILRQAYGWQATPFGKLQALPTNGRPVMAFTSRDNAWSEVARGIHEVAEQIRSHKS